MVRLRSCLVVAAIAAGIGFASTAHAGLEFCFESPECDDGDPCTCDFIEDGVCHNDPRARWASAARATGIEMHLGGETVIPPTPDSNETNPDMFAEIPADPLAHVTLMRVEEFEEGNNANGETFGRAVVTTGEVKVLDQGGGNWLLTADAIQSVSESFANDQTATSGTEGTTLKNVVLNGVNLGDVKESMDFTFQDPATKRRIDVRLLQKIRTGAAAGDPAPDPVAGVMVSGITVNAIRVTVRDMTDPANPVTEAEIIIARADTRMDRFNQNVCVAESAHTSGSGYVLNLDLDEAVVDPEMQLTRARIGDVLLPSRGGHDRSELAHVGPLPDPSGNVFLESGTAFSDTEGQASPGGAQSSTVSAIEELRAADQGDGPQIEADAVRAECTASSSENATTAKTTLVGLRLGGEDVCEALQLGPACTPEPNTRFTNDPNLEVYLNEQRSRPARSGCTDVTVNAVRIHALGAGNDFGLPAGADLTISNAHCDACPD